MFLLAFCTVEQDYEIGDYIFNFFFFGLFVITNAIFRPVTLWGNLLLLLCLLNFVLPFTA